MSSPATLNVSRSSRSVRSARMTSCSSSACVFAALRGDGRCDRCRTPARGPGARRRDTEVLCGEEALERRRRRRGRHGHGRDRRRRGAAPDPGRRAGKQKVLLANKEALVLSGRLLIDAVAASGAVRCRSIASTTRSSRPCLPATRANPRAPGAQGVADTSGGPFRTAPIDSLASVVPQQACAHPNWVMGRKISVDSGDHDEQGPGGHRGAGCSAPRPT